MPARSPCRGPDPFDPGKLPGPVPGPRFPCRRRPPSVTRRRTSDSPWCGVQPSAGTVGRNRTTDREVGDMQYLVTMTTHVPDGVSEEEVDDVRGREAAHSRELAAGGHLLRLWRPPLQPGEWRSLGLFAADDGNRLEEVLASMPLRIWRDDDVVPLCAAPERPAVAACPPSRREGVPHDLRPDRPGRRRAPDRRRGAGGRGAQRPGAGRPGVSRPAVDTARPRARARPLAGRQRRRVQAILAALPLGPWLEIETISAQRGTPATRRPQTWPPLAHVVRSELGSGSTEGSTELDGGVVMGNSADVDRTSGPSE